MGACMHTYKLIQTDRPIYIAQRLVTAVTNLKEFQCFEQRSFVQNAFRSLTKSFCSKRWNSL